MNRMLSKSRPQRTDPPVVLALLFALALLAVCGIFRQTRVGASDWYGYYGQADMFARGRLHLETRLDAARYPALAPLGFHVVNGRVVPQYPPGYPLLMAAASTLGLAFFVAPLFAVLTFLLLFVWIREETDGWTALAFALMWALAPVVLSSSTYVMSDIVATFFVLLGFRLFLKERDALSALALGFSIAVRPTNALFLLLLVPGLLRRGRWLRFGIGFAPPAVLYGIYNLVQYGAPWRTGYPTTSVDITAAVFTHHIAYYGTQILVQFTPVVIVLAVLGLAKKQTGRIFLSLWFLVLVVLYSFWRPGADTWWYTRFLLPSLPVLFILAARGWTVLKQPIERIGPGRRVIGASALVLLTLGVSLYSLHFSSDKMIFTTRKGLRFYEVSRTVAERVPADAVVGSLGFSGPLRLYTPLESFCLYHRGAFALINHLFRQGDPVYLVVQPWAWQDANVKKALRWYAHDTVMTFYGSDDFRLLHLTGKAR